MKWIWAWKLSPKESYFTEELVGILWTEFKLFISNWSRFDLYLPLLKPKKGFFFWLKAIPSPNLALKLAPNDNYFTEELVGRLWTEIMLFISFWKRFDLYFPLLKTKKTGSFFTSLLPKQMKTWKYESMQANLSQKALKLASNDNYFTEELNSSCLFQTERDLSSIFHC